MILVGNDSSYIWINLGHIFGAQGNLDPLLPCPHLLCVFSNQNVSKLTLKRHKYFFYPSLPCLFVKSTFQFKINTFTTYHFIKR